jgi:uncharacterized protein (DUF427 family)
MKALWNNEIIAEATQDELIRIEGNWYFPPSSIKSEYYKESDHHTTCFWKGEASYYDIVVGDQTNTFGAWYYPVPLPGSIDKVRADFSNYVAFWNGVQIVE